MPFVISANRLEDGVVVYLTQTDEWSVNVADARVVTDDDLDCVQNIGLDAEGRNHVVESYAVEVGASGTVLPSRLRERIRSHGPTVGDHQSRLAHNSEG
ncbi:MAG: DUF2849 domain-containing protein [Rhodospirillaceae bacterium]